LTERANFDEGSPPGQTIIAKVAHGLTDDLVSLNDLRRRLPGDPSPRDE